VQHLTGLYNAITVCSLWGTDFIAVSAGALIG